MPPAKGCRYPLPEELASRVKYDIAWPDFAAVKNLASFGVALKEDPQSPCGKAMCIARPLRMPEKGFHSKVLQTGVFSRTAKKAQVTKIFRVKADEKYHWYTLGEVKLDPVSILYVHRSWFLQHLLDRYYMPGEENRYEIRVSLKAAGPAYSPGSTAENALWLDRVLLLAPAGK